MRRRIVAAVAALAVAAVALTGCDASGVAGESEVPQDGISDPAVSYVQLPDGREVLCVATSYSYRAGISCDWGSASE
ncbi:hypothetical protein MRBLMI12_000443 [Microbacterium sp. LMI12-1-1.1]|uniref:hypothetical protein n=1 Tax=Microbacterium sp. LMI12-1-1.1 TaxID=3135225 RepID=UPI00342A8853